jgi:two-component system sensor histidine kinase SenX3
VSTVWALALAALASGAGAAVAVTVMRTKIPAAASYDPLAVLRTVLDVIPDAAAIVDESDKVVAASSNWASRGLLHAGRVAPHEVRVLHREALAAHAGSAVELTIVPNGSRLAQWEARIQVTPLDEAVTLIVAQDLSEERRLNDVRRDFVVNVSHELKTPVAALSLLAESVKVAASDPQKAAHFADRIGIEVTRLAELVSDLVELSRVQGEAPSRAMQRVTVAAIVAEAVDATRTSAEQRDIAVVVGDIDSQWAVYGDPSQLTTALRNLVSNAINYSPRTTRVGIGVRRLQGRMEISVTDQGPGIAPAEQARVFERFYRVDPARSRETGGTGLGLAIVKHVCANHGGEVTLWSRLGEGSTFTLLLPDFTDEGES